MRKKVLQVTGGVILLVGLLGFGGYQEFLKPDPKVEQQLNKQFGEDFFSFEKRAEKAQPREGMVTPSAKPTEGATPAVASPSDGAVDSEASETSGTSTPVQASAPSKPPSQQEISDKYKARFRELQSLALGRLDALYAAAVQEYQQAQKEGAVNFTALAQKYIQAGTKLEAGMDGQIATTLNAMEAELKANNYPTDPVDLLKGEYEKAKGAKRAQLFSKLSS